MTNQADDRAVPTTLSRAEAKKLLESFDTVMLCTAGDDGSLASARVRPMAVAKVADDCTMLFVTAIDSPKVAEAETEPHGRVTAQTKTRYASLSGTFRVTQHMPTIEAAWSKGAEIWFPDGKTDPRVAVLLFTPRELEVWDVSGANGIKYLVEAAKALATGTAPSTGSAKHEKVRIGG